MKKLILSLCLLAFSASTFAAGTQYESMMSALLTKLQDAKSPEALTEAKNGFIRVADVETKEWLPLYYAAYCMVLESYITKDVNEIDSKLDIADKFLDKAAAISLNDEVLCLQSWSKSARIMVNPMTRGQKYGQEASSLLEKAQEKNPNNPRVYFLKGQSAFYTPEAFGGGKEKAKGFFTKASELYNSKQLAVVLMPTWGKEETEKMLIQIGK